MVEVRYQNALSEVNEILKYTEKELIDKLPKSVMKFIVENKNNEYLPQIEKEKPLGQQKLLAETQAILSLFYRSYWATEDEKKEFAEKDIENN